MNPFVHDVQKSIKKDVNKAAACPTELKMRASKTLYIGNSSPQEVVFQNQNTNCRAHLLLAPPDTSAAFPSNVEIPNC